MTVVITLNQGIILKQVMKFRVGEELNVSNLGGLDLCDLFEKYLKPK